MTTTFLHSLARASNIKKSRDRIINKASKKQLNQVRNICANLCINKFKLNEKCRKKLYPFRKPIKQLASEKKLKSIRGLKKRLVQSGGFLPILLPAILSLLASAAPTLLERAIGK